DLSEAKVNLLVVSDTVLLWTDRASMMGFLNIVGVARALLVAGFYTGFPLRGAVSFGPLSSLQATHPAATSVSVNSLFGRALVDAYVLEQSQEWAGCVVDERCIDLYTSLAEANKNIPDLADLETLVAGGLLRRYDVPLHEGGVED